MLNEQVVSPVESELLSPVDNLRMSESKESADIMLVLEIRVFSRISHIFLRKIEIIYLVVMYKHRRAIALIVWWAKFYFAVIFAFKRLVVALAVIVEAGNSYVEVFFEMAVVCVTAVNRVLPAFEGL